MTEKTDPTTSHVYATTCYGWRVGQSIEECIKALARDVDKAGYARRLKLHTGLQVSTCTVPLPQSAAYEIEGYQPSYTPDGKAIELADKQRHIILSPTGDYVTL